MGPMDSGRACAMDKSEKSQRTSDSAWAECLQPKEEKPPDESRALTTPDESLPSVPRPSVLRPSDFREEEKPIDWRAAEHTDGQIVGPTAT
ncbi:hypothetical protein niasHT_037743 [Heterodera trifolii]